MLNYLLERSVQSITGSLTAEAEKMLGPLPPVLEGHQRDLLTKMFEYQLWKTYCTRNVQVVMTYGLHEQATSWSVKGLNSGQLKYIYGQFGPEVTEQQVKDLLEALAKTIKETNSLNELGRLFRTNIKNQSPLWPINGPADIKAHWGAKLIVAHQPLPGMHLTGI